MLQPQATNEIVAADCVAMRLVTTETTACRTKPQACQSRVSPPGSGLLRCFGSWTDEHPPQPTDAAMLACPRLTMHFLSCRFQQTVYYASCEQHSFIEGV